VTEKKFRVMPIPAPVAVFAGVSNGALSKNEASNAGVLKAELKNFLWDLHYEVQSFTLLFSKDGYDKEIGSETNNLTDEMKSIITDLKRGQNIYF
jgi:hypothetical protein